MALAAIELNDVAVTLARDDALAAHSPGFALLDKDTWTVGEDALRRARVEPRMVNTRFWERLSDEPVVPAGPVGRTHADLARAHLEQVWNRAGAGVESLILVVPGDYDRQRLGMVLGVTEQLKLPVRGMVDGALVACDGQTGTGLMVHVAVYLHRSVVSGIECGGRARRVFARTLEGHGLLRLYERWIALIGDVFVKTSRFDPLHRAESEQTIFDCLPKWLELLNSHDSLGIEMAARDGSTHMIRLARDQLAACARDYQEALCAIVLEHCPNRPSLIALDHQAAKLPGLAVALSRATDGAVTDLPAGAGALGALRRSAQIIESDWRNTVTVSLPCDAMASRPSVEASR